MDGLQWKTLLKWMIWGTPIFGNTHMYASWGLPKPWENHDFSMLPRAMAIHFHDPLVTSVSALMA